MPTNGSGMNREVHVPFCERLAGKFRWSTIESGIDLKSRKLPWSDDIEPSFVQMFEGEG